MAPEGGVAFLFWGYGMAVKAKTHGLLAQRLLQALTGEVDVLEKARPKRRVRKAGSEGEPASAEPKAGVRSGEGKARIEAIGHLTRTLEKLLELRQLEALTQTAEAEGDDAETERIRREMLKRLRTLDEKRDRGGGLFAPEPQPGVEH